MRPVTVFVLAAGASVWVPVNYAQNNFGIGLGYIPYSGASLTCKVQHSFDSHQIGDASIIAVTRVATVATVNWPNHGVDVGDSIIISGSGDANLDSPGSPATGGTYGVDVASVVDANNFTYTVANTGAAAGSVNTKARRLRVFDHATMTGMTTRTDGHYSYNARAVRLFATAYTSGTAELLVLEGMGR